MAQQLRVIPAPRTEILASTGTVYVLGRTHTHTHTLQWVGYSSVVEYLPSQHRQSSGLTSSTEAGERITINR